MSDLADDAQQVTLRAYRAANGGWMAFGQIDGKVERKVVEASGATMAAALEAIAVKLGIG